MGINLARSAPLTGGGTIDGDLTITGDVDIHGGGSMTVDQTVEGIIRITESTNAEHTGLILQNRDTTGDTGGSIGNRYDLLTTAGASVAAGKILVGKEESWTATGTTQDSFMAFYTSLDGTNAEKVRIDSDGKVGIGTTTPNSTLTVAGTDGSGILRLHREDTTIADDDDLGVIYFAGRDASGAGTSNIGAMIKGEAAGTWATDSNVNIAGTELQFYTQNNADSTNELASPRMVIDQKGNVGIGATAPTKELHVKAASAGATTLRVQSNGANDAILELASQHAYWNIYNDDTASGGVTDNSLRFSYDAVDDDKMVIQSDGYVGIGTTAPAVPLHISSDDEAIAKFQSSDAGAYIWMRDNNDNCYVGVHDGSGDNIAYIGGTAGASALNLNVTAAGNVGIGTTTPDGKLDVEGEDGHIISYVTCYSATDGHQPILSIRKSDGSTPGTPAATADGDSLGYIHFSGVNSGGAFDTAAAIFTAQDGASASDISGKLGFQTVNAGTATTQLMIRADGNVGIGETDPDDKLHITGNASSTLSLKLENPTADYNTLLEFYQGATLYWYVGNLDATTVNEFHIADSTGDGVKLSQDDGDGWETTSDLNLKTDISVISDALTKVNAIRGVNFKWKKYKEGADKPILPDYEITDEEWNVKRPIKDRNRVGVIAQEINEVLPEAVNTDGDWSVKYHAIIPLLVEAIKELSAEVEKLKNA